jgi:hypothetical protein
MSEARKILSESFLEHKKRTLSMNGFFAQNDSEITFILREPFFFDWTCFID